MSFLLNFKNWKRVHEAETATQTEPTSADLIALDSIQKVADLGPKRYNRMGGKTPGPETLITTVGTTAGAATSMGLANGQPYKLITFKTSNDPGNPKEKVNTIKAIFFAKDGVLNATVYKNDVQTLAGPVKIVNNGSFDQIVAIGDRSSEPLVPQSGVEADYDSFAAPIATGIANLFPANNLGTVAAAFKVPRGGSNVLWSKDNSLLRTFIAGERAKAATTPTQRP